MTEPTGQRAIHVRGARTHNLQGIDVDLPRNRLVVVSGPSGSGKSSLLFDTVFAEGRRRVLETLPASARAAAGLLKRPDVDSIRGLPPTVALRQAAGRAGRTATVSTLTDIDDGLRLLFARAGTAHCPQCDEPLTAQSVSSIVARLLSLPERSKVILHAPLARDEQGDHVATIEKAVQDGFIRVRVDGRTHEAANAPPLAADEPHTIEAVVDRLIVKPGIEERLRESVDLAVETGGGAIIATLLDDAKSETDLLMSTRFACGHCDVSYPDIDPRTFSFQSPYGACETCRGLGETERGICPACSGDRIGPLGRAVRLGDHGIADVRRMRPDAVRDWLERLNPPDGHAVSAVERCREDIARRLTAATELGLDYLSLDRPGRTLSGGELQRCRLIAALAGGLSGIAYVLDEPSAGLHPRDTQRLLTAVRGLIDGGATVLAVEHDEAIAAAADELFILGPEGGETGGTLVFAGRPSQRPDVPRLPSPRSEKGAGTSFTFGPFSRNNLDGVTIELPLARLTGVCGISGSGKSTLVDAGLIPALKSVLDGRDVDLLRGHDAIERVVNVPQSPLGRSARSCPATVLKVWSPIRSAFARTKLARLRGFEASRFSFNDPAGRCPSCDGRGELRLRSSLLPAASTECPDCRGLRFNPATLAVRFKDHSPGDVLAMTIREAGELFANLSRVAGPLSTAVEAGLGYLRLGQPSHTLSGGEAQRLRLSRELSVPDPRPTLFALDEPTAGLGIDEVSRLIAILRRLTAAGHTVVAVEHDPTFLTACDHLIDLGPGAGLDGGRVIATGSPADVANNGDSVTGPFLKGV